MGQPVCKVVQPRSSSQWSNFLTPYQRRNGLSDKILSKRKEVYEAAKAEHPERWNGRATRDWSLPDTVYLNPDKVHEQSEEADDQMAVS